MSNYSKLTNFATKDSLATGNPLKVIKGTEIDDEFEAIETAIGTKADLASPTFTGTPAAPTAAASTDSTQIATTAFVKDAISTGGYVATAGIADEAVTSAKIADDVDLGGSPTTTTQTVSDRSTKLATTDFVRDAIEEYAPQPSLTHFGASTIFGDDTVYDLPTDTFMLQGTSYHYMGSSQGSRLDIEVYSSTGGSGTLLETYIVSGGNELDGSDGGSGMSTRCGWSIVVPSNARSVKFVRGDGARAITGQIEAGMKFTNYFS